MGVHGDVASRAVQTLEARKRQAHLGPLTFSRMKYLLTCASSTRTIGPNVQLCNVLSEACKRDEDVVVQHWEVLHYFQQA